MPTRTQIPPFVFSVPLGKLGEWVVGVNTQRPHVLWRGWGMGEGRTGPGTSNKTLLVPAQLGYLCQRPRLPKPLGRLASLPVSHILWALPLLSESSSVTSRTRSTWVHTLGFNKWVL